VVAGADPGLNIRSLVDTGVSPGRSFQLLFIGLALAIWALTQHFSANHSRHPSGLTLAHQPALFTTTGIALRDNDVSNYAQTLPVVCAPSRTFLITPHRATRAMQSQLWAVRGAFPVATHHPSVPGQQSVTAISSHRACRWEPVERWRQIG
jgi:hypothetical protein